VPAENLYEVYGMRKKKLPGAGTLRKTKPGKDGKLSEEHGVLRE